MVRAALSTYKAVLPTASGSMISSTATAKRPGTMAVSSTLATSTRDKRLDVASTSGLTDPTMMATSRMECSLGGEFTFSQTVTRPTKVNLTTTTSKARANLRMATVTPSMAISKTAHSTAKAR